MDFEVCTKAPESWARMTIDDVCTRITSGGTPSRRNPEFFINGSVPWVKTQELKDGWIRATEEQITEDAVKSSSAKLLPAKSVLLAMYGATVGQLGVLASPMACNQACCALIVNDEIVDFRYVYYLLLQHRAVIKSLATGAAQQNLSAAQIKQFRFAFPDRKAQEQVADVLSGLDDKIDLNRRINQTLEAMAQAIFKSWFVDFDPVKAKIAAKQEGRDPLRAAMSAISGKPDAALDALPPEQYEQLAATAALFPDEMEESELGDIPRGWSVSKVETLLSRLSAKARYTKEQVSEYGQTPVFEQGASILLGYHNGVASYPASAESPMFIFGDHTCITRLSCQPFDISQNVIPLQGKNRATAWVYYAVKEKQKFQEYRRHWMELISKDVVVATVDICLEFSQRISKLHLQIEANERQMQSLREIRDTLLPKLLSGELSVTETIVEAEA